MNVLTAERIDAILNYADKLRIAADIHDRPMDVEKFIQKLSGSIEKAKMDDNGVIPNSRIIPGDGDKFIIKYHPNKDDKSDRFQLAHIVGHLLLHTNYIRDGSIKEEYVDKYFNDNDANLFASAILMPREQFLYVSSKNMIKSRYNVKEIADCFGVPERRVRDYGRMISSYRWSDI